MKLTLVLVVGFRK